MGALEVKGNKGSKNTEENKKLRPPQKSKESEEFGLNVRSMKKKSNIKNTQMKSTSSGSIG